MLLASKTYWELEAESQFQRLPLLMVLVVFVVAFVERACFEKQGTSNIYYLKWRKRRRIFAFASKGVDFEVGKKGVAFFVGAHEGFGWVDLEWLLGVVSPPYKG